MIESGIFRVKAFAGDAHRRINISGGIVYSIFYSYCVNKSPQVDLFFPKEGKKREMHACNNLFLMRRAEIERSIQRKLAGSEAIFKVLREGRTLATVAIF